MINSKSKINVINQTFAFQLGFKIWKTNVKAQKIDSITLETYKIVVFTVFILNKDSKVGFFKKNFLMANIKPNIVLEMYNAIKLYDQLCDKSNPIGTILYYNIS